MKIVRNGQHETSKMMRAIAIICVLLAVFMTGVEAAHAHSDASFTAHSAPCAICLSAHATTPSVVVYALPAFHSVEAVALPYEPEGKSAVSELRLFIRPPPSIA